MGHAAHVVTSIPPSPRPDPTLDPIAGFRFQSLILTERESLAGTRFATISVAFVIHTLVLAAVVVLPLLISQGPLPAPDETVRAFFATPADLGAPPPPPPPPPPAGPKLAARAPVAPKPLEEGRFTAPVLVPDRVVPEEALDLGVEGGVPGGVEGGVPGGVIGGIVGGLPSEAPPPPAVAVVRVGGNIKAPKVVHRVSPVYPLLGIQARVSTMVILDAQIDTGGRVVSVNVLRGHPLFDEAAIEAVKQWRYQPLLLNGTPTAFVLSVTVVFSLQQAQAKA